MNDVQEPNDNGDDQMDIPELLGWAEFCAWSALVMTPIIWWLQGPSVSTDQFVVRTSLLAISASTAVGLRGWALVQRWRERKMAELGNLAGTQTEQPKRRCRRLVIGNHGGRSKDSTHATSTT